MRLSRLFTKTSKTVPADETSKNAQLLIKAGFVNKTMAGVYSYLPLGLRVLNKIENIVRKNLNSIGAQEIFMNSIHPRHWWDQTGRWNTVDVLFKLKSQTENEYALAPTHEEQVTPLLQSYINSWKDLPDYNEALEQFPLSVYQLQTKFRDELRSKAGLMRGREFRMKDMYDLHTNKDSQDAFFEKITSVYHQIYEEMGLKSYAVNASGGSFSDKFSREFQVICDAGEDLTFIVPGTNLSYNQEIAPVKAPEWNNMSETQLPIAEVSGEGLIGVEVLAKFLNIPVEKTTKTILLENEHGDVIAAAVRGKYSISIEKLLHITGYKSLQLASPHVVKKVIGAEVGYAGLLHLGSEVKIFMDESMQNRVNFEMGANHTNYHSINVNFGRDLPFPDQFYDIKEAEKGMIHPESGLEYEVHKSAEVGNIFDLGQKWVKAFNLTYLDANNQVQFPYMGCHGIGTSRCMGVLAEIYSDDAGLKWPASVAPFQFHIITHINEKDDSEINVRIRSLAQDIYNGHTPLTHGLIDEVLWDDREGLGIGQKLADSELIGCPTTIVITKRSLESGGVEIRTRATGESTITPI